VFDESRIEALRKRLQKDPGSIAFAQLGEEYRRAGRFQEAIEVCRAGLARHPGYLSARVTLGRALLEVGDIASAEHELTDVMRQAPDNLSAIRGLAEVHRRRGEAPEAPGPFEAAFDLAGSDPAIEQILRDLRRDAVLVSPRSGSSGTGNAPTRSAGERERAGMVTAPAAAAVSPAPADDTRAARRTLAYLERWLEAILADRRSRLYVAPA
jgi:tetratricopeptide (TPR) repeat protein